MLNLLRMVWPLQRHHLSLHNEVYLYYDNPLLISISYCKALLSLFFPPNGLLRLPSLPAKSFPLPPSAPPAVPLIPSIGNPDPVSVSNPTLEANQSEELPELPPAAITTSFEIEKRWKSAILREPGWRSGLQRREPPNFEIGWKRTKEIKIEKPKGWVIADFLEKLEGLMARGRFGTAELLAKTGEIVAERAREEAEVLQAGGEVEERMVTELHRVLRLMEMDLAMVRAAVKEETLAERIEQARARCRQAILVALSF